jgi:hypothetical protein
MEQVSGGIFPITEELAEDTKRQFTFKLNNKIDILEDHDKEIKGGNSLLMIIEVKVEFR